MVKLVALFRVPDDVEAFERTLSETLLPAVRRLPDVARVEVARVTGAPFGEPDYYRLVEVYYPDRATMVASLRSDAGAAAAKSVMTAAARLVHLMFAEIEPAPAA